MGGQQNELAGPDLAAGIPIDAIADGATVLGHAEGESGLLAHR